MEKRDKRNFIISACLLLLFIIYTIIVKYVDVSVAGETMQEVGLSSLNTAIFDAIGVSLFWNRLTIYLGYIILIIPVIFVVIAFVQWIKRKQLKLVDREFYILAMFYVMIACLYILFEELSINNRPVFVDGEIEASYPSSHSLLACSIIGSAIILISHRIRNKKIAIPLISISAVILVVEVVGRLLSGVHWFTDIIGGIILGAFTVHLLYAGLSYYWSNIKNRIVEDNTLQDVIPEAENL